MAFPCEALSFQARNIRIGRSGAEAGNGFPHHNSVSQKGRSNPHTSIQYGWSAPSLLHKVFFDLLFFLPNSWGQTCISVAQGCSPAFFGECEHFFFFLAGELFYLCPAFFVHLLLLLFLVLLRTLVLPFGAPKCPFGRVIRLPSAGVPSCILLPLACATPGQPVLLHFAASVSRAEERRHRSKNQPRRLSRKGVSVCNGTLTCFGCSRWMLSWLVLPSLPLQVWAMPQPWGEAVDIILAAVRLFPEPLQVSTTPSRGSGACISAQTVADSWISTGLLAHSERDAAALLPLQDAEHLPIPPPDLGTGQATEGINVQAYCYVMSPGFHAEIVSLPLHMPCTVEGICAEIKAALHALELRFAFHVLPTIPQLGPDFASFVATPAWAQDAGKQVIVYDFQDLGGPVYSSIVWTRVTFGDCEAEARRHNITNWSVYVQGCSQQLEAGASFLAFPGGVVQFRPEGQPAFWRSPLPSRLDRHIDWSADPELPDYGTEWPLFVTYHDLHVLFSTKRYPEVPILAFLADRIERGPGDFLIIAPPGNILQNIDFHGVSCRDALAIYPLSPNTERDAIVVFLDARTTGAPITHVLLPEPRVDPAFLIRWLSLTPPPGYKTVFRPRVADDGRLHLTEGAVVTFGFVEARPGDTSSESSDDSIGFDSGSEDGSGPDPSEPPRGPPPAVPISDVPGASVIDGTRQRPERSRTPNRRGSDPATPQGPS